MATDGINIEHYTAVVVLAALVMLALLAHGFRGVSAGGLSIKAS